MDLGMEQECDYILLANAVSAWKYAMAMFGNKIYKSASHALVIGLIVLMV